MIAGSKLLLCSAKWLLEFITNYRPGLSSERALHIDKTAAM
jgi:hypothetical protein